MTIADMQQAILNLGWQFQEHIFNDGLPECYVQFSKDKSPHVFGSYVNDEACDEELRKARRERVGWGRFRRQWAWQQAYDYIVLGVRSR